jgi:hypothetical protein
VVLTVKGKAAYQRVLDVAASADADEGIRQGLEDVKKGRTRPAREFFRHERTAVHTRIDEAP